MIAIEETYETGLILKGSEIKSIREKKVNIEGAYVLVKNNEAFNKYTYYEI